MNLTRLFHTVKYLKPVQIYGRLWFQLYKPKPDISPAPATRSIKSNWVSPCKKNPSLLSPYCFRFLNQVHELNSVKDWNNPRWEKLWLYNLHYFDDLQACDAENKKVLHLDLIGKWIEENPPGMGNGWEPYPASLRIVNWIKWALAWSGLPDKALHSLAVQVRYLFKKPEVHLLGNHLLANAKALVFAGLFFDDNEVEFWLNKGLKILSNQLPEQILNDGGHFERSPMYHSIILEDLLDLINIADVYSGMIQEDCLEEWREKSRKMLSALNKQCHPNGDIAFFNDTAISIAASLDEIKAYASRLGVFEDEELDRRVGCLPNTGYYSVKRNNWFLIIDAAPVGPDYLPGHAHADTLSFELSMGRQRVLVNSGTSCYEVGRERLRQRQTAAHNTLLVDEQDSSEVWSGFRVARRARIVKKEIKISHEKDMICATHNGFERLKSVGLHQRIWVFSDEELVISDSVVGSGTHCVCVFFHFYPSLHVKTDVDGWHICDAGKKLIAVMTLDKTVDGFLQESTYHPEFGLSIPNQVVIGKVVGELPLNISTKLIFV
ncbi:MAG: alginate lyase family protein [Deltaproteobacteria bacterium]|nr:alginate lyase family protein [Deltaproteobacteria bacterium]